MWKQRKYKNSLTKESGSPTSAQHPSEHRKKTAGLVTALMDFKTPALKTAEIRKRFEKAMDGKNLLLTEEMMYV